MATYINHVAIAAPRNGTTSHTVSPSSGTVVAGALFTPTAGNLLVVVHEGAVTATTPSGWTLPTNGSAINNTGLYVWYRTAAGGDSITTTHNGSNYPVIIHFIEFYAGSSFVAANSAINITNGTASPSVTGLTGTNWTAGAMGQGDPDPATTYSVTWATGTELVDYSTPQVTTDGYNYSLTYTEDNTATSAAYAATSTRTGSFSEHERLAFAVQVVAAPTTGPTFDDTAFDSATFYTSDGGAAQNITAVSISTAESLGTSVITTSITTSPSGVITAQALGTPAVATTITSSPSGGVTAEALGTPTVATTITCSPAGVASAEAFGSTTATVAPPGAQSLSPTAISTAEAFGTSVISTTISVSPSGLATVEVFGIPSINSALTLSPQEIISIEALGTASVSSSILCSALGISTSEAVGTPTISTPGGGSATVAQRGITTNATGTTTAVSVSTPSGVIAGDLIVYSVAANGGGGFTPPAGFTLDYTTGAGLTNPKLHVSWKIATGSEGSTLDGTLTTAVAWSAQVSVYSGVDNSNPWDVPISATEYTLSTTTAVTAPSLAAGAVGRRMIGGASGNSSSTTWTPPTNPGTWTELYDAGVGKAHTFADYDDTVGGASGIITFTQSAGRAAVGWSGALKPAPGTALPAINCIAVGVGSSEAFGTPALSTSVTLSSTAISSSESFGSTIVTTVIALAPSAIATLQALGTPTVSTVITLNPSGLNAVGSLGNPAASTSIISTPTSITSVEVFGTGSITSSILLSPTGVASTEAMGFTTAFTGLTMIPTGIGSALALGTATISTVVSSTATGIATAQAFGTTTVSAVIALAPSSITSGYASGNPQATLGALSIAPSAIASIESFGAPIASASIALLTSGIASALVFGTPAIQPPTVTMLPSGFNDLSSAGNPTITSSILLTPSGIISAVAVGTPSITTTIILVPTGLATAATFGNAIVSNLKLSPSGISSIALVSTPFITAVIVTQPTGIGTEESFGLADLEIDLSTLLDIIFTASLAPRNKSASLADRAKWATLSARDKVATIDETEQKLATLMDRPKSATLAEPIRTQELS